MTACSVGGGWPWDQLTPMVQYEYVHRLVTEMQQNIIKLTSTTVISNYKLSEIRIIVYYNIVRVCLLAYKFSRSINF